MFSQNISFLSQNINTNESENISDIAAKPILFANFLKDFSNEKGTIEQYIDDPSTLINIPIKKYEPKKIVSENLSNNIIQNNVSKKNKNINSKNSKKAQFNSLLNNGNISQIPIKNAKINSIFELFSKNETRKKMLSQLKKDKNINNRKNKRNYLKNNTQIKEEFESESDSVSIDDEENNIIKTPFKNQDIISIILNESQSINDNYDNIYEKLNNIDLNDMNINSNNNNNIIFCSIKINSIFTSKECKVTYAIFSFDKNYKKDNCDCILYKLDSQKEDEFIQIIQKIKNSNSFQKCELLKKDIFSNNDSIINDLSVYYLKKSLF
jgi:hypothetical protein